MKDIFGNKKPIQVEIGEYWFNGNIIQLQSHPKLLPFIVFRDREGLDSDLGTQGFHSYKEAIQYCLDNPCYNPFRQPGVVPSINKKFGC